MIKTIDYEFPRGDSYFLQKFRVKDLDGNIVELKETDKLYFTLKRDSYSLDFLVQKKIDSGITLGIDGYYHIEIEPGDTNNLDYGTYVYDIQIKQVEGSKTYVKTLINGTITLTEEVTWGGNE